MRAFYTRNDQTIASSKAGLDRIESIFHGNLPKPFLTFFQVLFQILKTRLTVILKFSCDILILENIKSRS